MDLTKINLRLEKIKNKITSLARQIDRLDEEYDELERAKDTILQYIGSDTIDPNPPKKAPNAKLTSKQNIVLNAVPIGKDSSMKPIEIAEMCPRLNADYVRTTLRRLVEAEIIEFADGFYWFEL